MLLGMVNEIVLTPYNLGVGQLSERLGIQFGTYAEYGILVDERWLHALFILRMSVLAR